MTKDIADVLRRRNLITQKTDVTFDVQKGRAFQSHVVTKATDLTAEMIASNSWKESNWKDYCMATGKPLNAGALHPLMKVRSQFRQILLEMGFEEMPTNKFLECSFWNFDALFQPQHHPARDAHDTFFIEHPSKSTIVDEDYFRRVQTMHEQGGAGSIGFRSLFSIL